MTEAEAEAADAEAGEVHIDSSDGDDMVIASLHLY